MCCMCGPPPGVSDDLPDMGEVDSEGEEEVLMCVVEAGHPRVFLKIFLTT